MKCVCVCPTCTLGCRGGSVAVSDDAEQELSDVLGSNLAVHP